MMIIHKWKRCVLLISCVSFCRAWTSHNSGTNSDSWAGIIVDSGTNVDGRTGIAQGTGADIDVRMGTTPDLGTHGDRPLMAGDQGNDIQYRLSNSMLQYVMRKGCDYLMAFVKGHYYRGHDDDDYRSTPSDCDWKPWVERSCYAHHVPPEVCCALIDCGATRSMVAFGAPHLMVEKCNMTTEVASMHGPSAVGRRETPTTDPPSTNSTMCENYDGSIVFGKRDIMTQRFAMTNFLPVNSSIVYGNITSYYSSSHVNGFNVNNQSLSSFKNNVDRWCKNFSRRINKKYHFDEIQYVRRSVYWVVDVYKTAQLHHVPKSYTHGLVGCGLDFAMAAFNAQQWQTVLYHLVLK